MIIEHMAMLILQLGLVLFAVRLFGGLAKLVKVPQVLGELIAGIVIGPYALGGIALPGFEKGIFPMDNVFPFVSTELYAFAVVGSIFLLFASGLETNIRLFLRYSLAGGLISTGGVLMSFVAGDVVGMFFFDAKFMDSRCLFLGLLIASNSLGIVARVLSDQKKMDRPESVTILAASIFDDVLTIIVLAVVLGIVTAAGGESGMGSIYLPSILGIAGKAFGIWLGFTALGLLFSKKLAFVLKLFKSSYDFSMLALSLSLVLAGVFEKQGLAMIIGAYIGGLSLSRTDIAPVIQERIRSVYDFFVPVFFAVTGMMVNYRDIVSGQVGGTPVLVFGALFACSAAAAKLVGCGTPALFLGFNLKGALRIGLGMAPRGEMSLILAGIGLALGVLTREVFAVVVLMILITTLAVPPLLSGMLRISGRGTRRPVRNRDIISISWEFPSSQIADLVINTLLDNLRSEGFYIQTMDIYEGLSEARKDDISLSIHEHLKTVTIKTAKTDAHFVKTAVYEVLVELYESIRRLRESSDPQAMKKELLESGGRNNLELLAHIKPECTSIHLNGDSKEAIITELVDLLAAQNKLLDRDMVLADVLERERTMSTGMEHGIAFPHAKTDGVEDLEIAVGIRREGVDFGSMDGQKSRLFILIVSPKQTSWPHLQFLAAISSHLRDEAIREDVINADTPEKAAELLQAEK